MRCPHCLIDFHDRQTWWSVVLGGDTEGQWVITRRTCPACNRFVLGLENGTSRGPITQGQQNAELNVLRSIQVWPKGVARAPVPPEVPPGIIEDYKEACLVLSDSPKASAALSRRCLQNLLRQAAGVKPGDLSGEIQQIWIVANCRKTLPTILTRFGILGISLLIQTRARVLAT